jgi:hypothetical protein
MENNNFTGVERRSYTRVVYKPSQRPLLQIDSNNFQVADVSQEGLRFINDDGIILNHWIRGVFTFLYGESIEIEGRLEWQQDDDFGVRFKYLISSKKIFKEQRHILLNCD